MTQSTAPQATKACPYCGEEILAAAIKCKHCGEFLSQTAAAARGVDNAPLRQEQRPVLRSEPSPAAKTHPREIRMTAGAIVAFILAPLPSLMFICVGLLRAASDFRGNWPGSLLGGFLMAAMFCVLFFGLAAWPFARALRWAGRKQLHLPALVVLALGLGLLLNAFVAGAADEYLGLYVRRADKFLVPHLLASSLACAAGYWLALRASVRLERDRSSGRCSECGLTGDHEGWCSHYAPRRAPVAPATGTAAPPAPIAKCAECGGMSGRHEKWCGKVNPEAARRRAEMCPECLAPKGTHENWCTKASA